MAQTKLQAIGLRHEYYQPRTGGRLLALDNINLQVDEGEFVTIVGPSGCGKTTFINLCDGLLKPTAGKIVIDGKAVTGPGTDRGMVFQDSCLMPWRTVLRLSLLSPGTASMPVFPTSSAYRSSSAPIASKAWLTFATLFRVASGTGRSLGGVSGIMPSRRGVSAGTGCCGCAGEEPGPSGDGDSKREPPPY